MVTRVTELGCTIEAHSSGVQPPQSKVEETGKQRPHQIGNHESSSESVNLREHHDTDDNRNIQQCYLNKCLRERGLWREREEIDVAIATNRVNS